MNYDTLPDASRVEKTAAGLRERGFEAQVVASGAKALAAIKALIPAGASVFNGTSRTLDEIGYLPYVKSGGHPWRNHNEAIVAETDPAKQALLRKQASIADWYLGSVHALTEDGELVIASASGSQLPAIVFDADNVILVASTQKITADLDDGLRRLREHVFPLEDARMKSTGAPGSVLSKILIYERNPGWGRTFHVILVNEKLGF